MLVLSRKKCQQVLFPNLGIKVEILRIAGNTVSLGIKAPESVQILRGELTETRRTRSVENPDVDAAQAELLHKLRNQMHQAQLIVSLARKQLQQGSSQDADETLQGMLRRLGELEAGVASMPSLASGSANASSQIPSQPKHALIVEDDANERTLLAAYLRLSGFRVSEASDGLAALEFLKTQSVDLIVLDMRMPRLNGLETLKAIREQKNLQHTKVVIVSGEDREQLDTRECRAVDHWFTKPLNPDHLVGQLQSLAT